MNEEISGDVEAIVHDALSCVREIVVDDVAWIATCAGHSAAGSGVLGLGMLEGVDFALAADPATPIREALVQRGRFANMYDEEIIALCRNARPVTHRVMPRKPLEKSH